MGCDSEAIDFNRSANCSFLPTRRSLSFVLAPAASQRKVATEQVAPRRLRYAGRHSNGAPPSEPKSLLAFVALLAKADERCVEADPLTMMEPPAWKR